MNLDLELNDVNLLLLAITATLADGHTISKLDTKELARLESFKKLFTEVLEEAASQLEAYKTRGGE